MIGAAHENYIFLNTNKHTRTCTRLNKIISPVEPPSTFVQSTAWRPTYTKYINLQLVATDNLKGKLTKKGNIKNDFLSVWDLIRVSF